jgi:hypothetical protein
VHAHYGWVASTDIEGETGIWAAVDKYKARKQGRRLVE